MNNLSQGNLIDVNLTGTDNLIFLDLSHNNIEYLPSSFLDQLDKKIKSQSQILTVDFTGNNLTCECRPETMNFLKWMIGTHKMLNFKHLEQITCTGKYGIRSIHTIKEGVISKWHLECLHIYTTIYIIISAIFSILLTVCSFYCFKWRYVVAYKVFKLRQSLVRCCSHHPEEETSLLMKTLEEKHGFKLCIHYEISQLETLSLM